MAVTITHTFVSSKPQSTDGTVVSTNEWNAAHTVTGLENVNNTSDANKPISTATQAALDAKQPLDSDLTAIAALATTSYGRGLLTLANQAALQTEAGGGGSARTKLAANLTLYVRTDGSDSNNGTANTAGGAFLTINKALHTVADSYDLAGYIVTIQVADGTYTTPISIGKAFLGSNGPECVVVKGNTATPANVLVSVTGTDAFRISGTGTGTGLAQITVQDLEVRTITSGNSFNVAGGGTGLHFKNIRFGACAGIHLSASHGAWILAIGDYAVTGGGVAHIGVASNALCAVHGWTLTFSNSPAFSVAFTSVSAGGRAYFTYCVFTNKATVTGPRFSVGGGGLIDGDGTGDTTFLPGSTGGVIGAGGQYDSIQGGGAFRNTDTGAALLVDVGGDNFIQGGTAYFRTAAGTSYATITSTALDHVGDITWAGVASTTWSPTITGASGTVGAVTINGAKYKRFGKLVFARIDAFIAVGSASGGLRITLPVNAVNFAAGVTGFNFTGSFALTGYIYDTAATNMKLMKYDGSNPFTGTLDERFVITLIYEGV